MAEFTRKGITLSFGLISETVRLTGAIDKSAEVSLNTVCVGTEQGTDHAPVGIKSQYVCTECGPISDRSTLRKGRKVGSGFQLVDTDQIKEVKSQTADTFKGKVALTAHPAEQVLTSTVGTGSFYYLSPEGAGDRYAIIRDLIDQHPELSFVAQYTVSSRVSMYVAHVRDGAIMLESREGSGKVKDAPDVSGESNQAMLGMAEQLLDQLVVDFDAATYADTYTEKLQAMLEASQVVEALPTEGEAPAAAAVSDEELMAKLAEMLPQKKPAKRAAARRKAS